MSVMPVWPVPGRAASKPVDVSDFLTGETGC